MLSSLGFEIQSVDNIAREQLLQERVDELTDFIENASIPLHWVNGSGIIIWANKAELELLGYTKDEYIGKHISNFHGDKLVCEDILSRLVLKQTLQNYPAMLKAKDGRMIPVLINSNVRWKDGKFIHTRCFTRDITDLKKSESEKVNLINDLLQQIKLLKSEIARLRNENLKKD